MNFIGVITENKNEEYIYNLLKKNLGKNFDIMIINEKNIENYKNITFNCILINSNAYEKYRENMFLYNILEKSEYIILNSDIVENLKLVKDLKAIVITFGLEHKATITVSSRQDDRIMLSVQRNIIKKDGSIIEIQEVEKEIVNRDSKCNLYNLMGVFVVLMLYV